MDQIMTLQTQLEQRRAQSKIAPEKRAVMNAAINELAESGITNGVIKVGEKAPDFELVNIDGQIVRLFTVLENQPVVLMFYRGVWCPYCNMTVKAYQEILPEIERLGATLIAVSPQTPDNSLTMAQKHDLSFYVLSDLGNLAAREYGLVYQLPPELREIYLELHFDLTEYNGDETWELPLPGTFVIDQDGIVRYAFAHADYVKRAEPAEILAALEKLNP